MMEDTPKVRTGIPADVDHVMELALAGAQENGFLEYDPVKILQEVWSALNLDHGLMGVIGPVGGSLQGAILLRTGDMWYSSMPVLEERAIFVHPDFRKAAVGRARLLSDFSKKAADGLGMPLIIGVLSNHRTASKIKLYERQFGPASGAFFLYGARTGEWRKSIEDAAE